MLFSFFFPKYLPCSLISSSRWTSLCKWGNLWLSWNFNSMKSFMALINILYQSAILKSFHTLAMIFLPTFAYDVCNIHNPMPDSQHDLKSQTKSSKKWFQLWLFQLELIYPPNNINNSHSIFHIYSSKYSFFRKYKIEDYKWPNIKSSIVHEVSQEVYCSHFIYNTALQKQQL